MKLASQTSTWFKKVFMPFYVLVLRTIENTEAMIKSRGLERIQSFYRIPNNICRCSPLQNIELSSPLERGLNLATTSFQIIEYRKGKKIITLK